MSEYKAYRVKIDASSVPQHWAAVFLDKDTGEVAGSFTFVAPSKEAAKYFAMGYCTAFYRAGLAVIFDIEGS